MSGYLMEHPGETERLEAKTDAEQSRQQLALVGLAPGARALDAGAGSGAVARTMAGVVAPGHGRVTALDRSAERVRYGAHASRSAGLENLEFVHGNLLAPPFGPGTFDFVWCRFVLEYLAAPEVGVESLVRILRPGGKLVVGDVDGHGMHNHPVPAVVARGLDLLVPALRGRFDPFAGRKLYHLLRRAGLEEVRVHALPYHLYAGAAPPSAMANWQAKLTTLRPLGARALGTEQAYDEFADAFLAMLRDPETLTYSVLFLVEGTKPT